MAKIEDLVQDFLSQKVIAIVGVSAKRETGSNLNYKRFKENAYRVYAVNPRIPVYDGAPCYSDLKSIPEKPEVVFVLASPNVTEAIVRECIDLGIKRVWMHCQLGTKPGLSPGRTSVSRTAVEMCRANGIVVIPGSCPAQFLTPDFAHGMMRRLWTMCGFMSVE
jgi:uncharacterized protein